MVVDRAQRHRVLKAGSITFGGAAIDCVVRNQSATGAALEIASPMASLMNSRLCSLLMTFVVDASWSGANKNGLGWRSIRAP
jgi:hypothetical protein